MNQTRNNSTTTKILLIKSVKPIDQKEILKNYLAIKHQVKKFPSPQIHIINPQQTTLSIAMVRQIKQEANFTSYSNNTRFFCFLGADQATLAAQNALLKLIEEPPSNSHCLLLVNNLNPLLATIRSRCLIEYLSDDKMNQSDSQANKFLHKFFINSKDYSYSQIIDWAKDHKARDQAQEVISQTLEIVINKPYNDSHIQALALKTLNKILIDLKRNFNVKLCLEHNLFSAKKTLE